MKFTFDTETKTVTMHGAASLGEMQELAVALANTYGGAAAEIQFDVRRPAPEKIEVNLLGTPLWDWKDCPRTVYCGAEGATSTAGTLFGQPNAVAT